MSNPGIEPGLPRPQRGVLTARRIRQLIYKIHGYRKNVRWKSIFLQRKRAHPGSNQGPADLQSAALPLSYTPSAGCLQEYKNAHEKF